LVELGLVELGLVDAVVGLAGVGSKPMMPTTLGTGRTLAMRFELWFGSFATLESLMRERDCCANGAPTGAVVGEVVVEEEGGVSSVEEEGDLSRSVKMVQSPSDETTTTEFFP
jgi:hypothetical protein